MMMTNFFKNFFRKKSARFVFGAFALCWTLFAAVFYVFYRSAYAHLQANDPRRLNNRSELVVTYNSLRLRRGEEFSPEDLTGYLDELGYVSSAGEIAGSYFTDKNSVTFSPRSAAYRPATVQFEKRLIKKITLLNARTVENIELEPLPMRSFVRYVNRENLKPQLVRRTIISADAVPEKLADAVTGAEDARFYEHHGLDVFGIGYRVITRRGGGSSITQQIIKNNVIKGAGEEFWQRFLGFLPETAQRKAMEIPFALAAEEMMGKPDIMAAYLSVVPLGASSGVELHGVISASQEYFGKPVSELSLAECATLAGIIHKPSFYVSLARNNDYAELIARRNRILDLMRRNHPGKYPAEEIEKTKSEPLKFLFASENRAERPADAYSRLFSAYIANHLPENLAELRQNEGNFQITTTLDYRLQKAATEISEKAISDLTKKVYAECLRQKPARVDCRQIKPQIALVAMAAETGEILAMYGGNSLEFNFAAARRSPASAVKPFYYLLANQEGIWQDKPFTPETVINPETDTVNFRPKNNLGVKSPASVGLAKSYNFHAVAAAESAGIKRAVEFAGKLTNSTPEISGMSAIGGSRGSEASLLALVSAYSVFANRGVLVKPAPNRFYVVDEERFALPKPEPERAATAESALKTNEMMKLVLSPSGTAPNFKKEANLLNFPEVSAKTGSGMVADLWFFAVTPKLIVGVWAGLPNNEITLDMKQGFTGGKVAAPIAARFFQKLQKSNPDLLKAR